MFVVTWLLARKVEHVGHMDSAVAGSMNVRSYLTTSQEGRTCWSHGQCSSRINECS